MSRSSRLFEIIQMLRHANGPLAVHAIADALEVSQRTRGCVWNGAQGISCFPLHDPRLCRIAAIWRIRASKFRAPAVARMQQLC